MSNAPDPSADPSADVSSAAVTILTTEHYNLQTARVATISEGNGRASLFLGAVSAGLVALAFAGQSSRPALYTFGLVLFPVLAFRPGRWQLLLSIVGAIGVINSVLLGTTGAMAVAALTDGELWWAVPTGVVIFAVALPLHERHQHRVRVRATRPGSAST